MASDKQLRSAGILISRDSVDVEHLRFAPENQARVRRFSAFQQAVIDTPSDVGGRTFACLIALELITPQVVRTALGSTPYCYRTGTYLEWEQPEEERLDRRRLCAITTLQWKKRPPNIEEDWSHFTSWLMTLAGYKNMLSKEAMEALALDQLSWAARKLPMALFGHVSGLRPMTALPRDTLLRESSGLVSAIVLDEKSIDRETQVADFVDVVNEVNEEKCQPENDGMVRMATDLLTTKKDEPPDLAVDRWVVALLNLRPRVSPTNVATALVLSWMLDLCESGTAKKSDADYLTRRRYCVKAALPLWRMLSTLGGHPEAWDIDAFSAGMLAVMEDPSVQDKTAVGAGLSSFQSFLQEHWDIDLPIVSLHKLIPPPRPRAQFVTPIEVNRALDWASGQKGGDSTLLRMGALAIAMGSAAPFRIRELLYLRMRNIKPLKDGNYEVEIVRFGWRNKLKSAAAVRRVLIRDPQAIEMLAQHLEQRYREGASSKDLMFSAPISPIKIYRQHALQRTMLRMLKLATGDPQMTFHALRHTWACRQVGDVLCSNSIVDFNRLIHIAEAMGHVTPATTLYFYSHLFEDAIWSHTSAAVRATLVLSPKTAQLYTGESPNTLRTRAGRKDMEISEAVWQAIDNAAEGIAFPDVAMGIALITPPCPSLTTTLIEGLTPWKVLEVLRLLCETQHADGLVAARTRTSEEEVGAIRAAACEVAQSQCVSRRRKGQPVAIESVGSATDAMGINLSSADQAKFASLKNALAVAIDPTVASSASESWLQMRDRGYLSLEHPNDCIGLLRLLKLSDVTPSKLGVCMQYEKANAMDAKLAISDIRDTFSQVWSGAPHFYEMDVVHPARPHAYLIWPTHPGLEKLGGPAANSKAGLESLMLAVSVYSLLSGENHAVA